MFSTRKNGITDKPTHIALLTILSLLLITSVLLHLPSRSAFAETQEKKKGHLAADLRWAFYDVIDQFDKHFKLPFMIVENGTPDRYEKIVAERNVAVPMRDGTLLYANIYRPKSNEKFPAIVTRLPYGKDEYYCYMPAIGKFWARKGYAFIAQDVRGKFASEGEFDPLANEVEDGYDTLDWVAKQPWCDGNIGMEGESYYGYTTWAGAVGGHPNLKCISPMNTAMDFHEATYQDGALTLQTAGLYPIYMHGRTYENALRIDRMHLPLITMDDAADLPNSRYDTLIKHPFRDEVTEAYNLHTRRDRIELPMLVVAGWYDVFLKTTLDDWSAQKQKNEATAAAGEQWLLIAPIDHESTPLKTHRIGRLEIGNKGDTTILETRQAFFDHFLKGIDNGFEKNPPVRIFVIGDNDWRYESEWPSQKVSYTDYYFHSAGKANTLNGDGVLDLIRQTGEPTDTYSYDPAHPVMAHFDIDIWSLAAQMKDRRVTEERNDVLVYTSPVLEQDMEITGPISVTLYAASSAVDTDFTAALVDEFPDGYLHLIQEGIQRASYRESAAGPILIEPGKVYQYTIDLWATSYVLKAGHKIRVEISSSNFDRFSRNLNTGAEFGMTSEMVKASQEIFHTGEYPSHITLPIIPR